MKQTLLTLFCQVPPLRHIRTHHVNISPTLAPPCLCSFDMDWPMYIKYWWKRLKYLWFKLYHKLQVLYKPIKKLQTSYRRIQCLKSPTLCFILSWQFLLFIHYSVNYYYYVHSHSYIFTIYRVLAWRNMFNMFFFGSLF